MSGDKLESDERNKVTGMSRAGKATGNYYNCFNVKNDRNGNEMSFGLSAVEWRKVSESDFEDVNIVTIPKCKNGESAYVEVKSSELSKLQEFKTFEEVEDTRQPRITTTWVLWWKSDIVRARLVARGFKEELFLDVINPLWITAP